MVFLCNRKRSTGCGGENASIVGLQHITMDDVEPALRGLGKVLRGDGWRHSGVQIQRRGRAGIAGRAPPPSRAPRLAAIVSDNQLADDEYVQNGAGERARPRADFKHVAAMQIASQPHELVCADRA